MGRRSEGCACYAEETWILPREPSTFGGVGNDNSLARLGRQSQTLVAQSSRSENEGSREARGSDRDSELLLSFRARLKNEACRAKRSTARDGISTPGMVRCSACNKTFKVRKICNRPNHCSAFLASINDVLVLQAQFTSTIGVPPALMVNSMSPAVSAPFGPLDIGTRPMQRDSAITQLDGSSRMYFISLAQ